MTGKNSILGVAIIVILLGSTSTALGRSEFATDGRGYLQSKSTAGPAQAIVAHRIGKIVLSVNNNGTFGKGFAGGVPQDFFTGEAVPSCE